MIATATAETVSLLNINRRIQMRRNNIDFLNRKLPTNVLALLLVTTRGVTPDDTQRHQEQSAIAPLNQSNILARLLVTTRDVTTDDTPRVLRHCDFPDSRARQQEETAIAIAA